VAESDLGAAEFDFKAAEFVFLLSYGSRISYLVLRVAFRVSNFELIIFTIMHHASRITHHPGAER
jgi:hypothetical protein